ncbi:hypothetical protein GCM10009754_39050 [Amycolatopsis minnesotensis]|uniref:PE-PGRS family protein n=1 Tax=Amycolatopsis minnesotensis TaxID=337894 RepID=A0ABN2R4Y0_9PSEU
MLGPRRTRTVDEIPRSSANQRLVYRVAGDFVLDNSALPLNSPTVLGADHVSVVDVSRECEVLAQLDIPSADADSFTMQATFVCTVTDPIAVVREGPSKVETALRAYLKGHHRIFELGLDYRLGDINEARRKLNAQVKAFTTISPPEFLGLSAELTSVEVRTPEELAKFQQSLREQEQRHVIDFKLQEGRHHLHRDETEYEQRMAARSQRHQFDLDANQRQYDRYQYREHAGAVGSDPLSSLTYAYSIGKLDAKEFAEELLRRDQERLETSRTDERRRLEWEREDIRAQREIERDERKRGLDWRREDAKLDRQDRRRQLEAKIEIIRDLAQRGFLDTANVDLENVVNAMVTGGTEFEADRADVAEIAPPADGARGERGDDVEMREEDVH